MVKRRESVSVVLEIVLVFLLLKQISGNFNLYVDKEEFHRITGGTLSQVYLVRDGVVNDYALGYVMTIPYHIQYLDFKWQATTKKPVHYEMLIEFSDFFALLQPSANVSKVGRLPHKLETFRVSLPCSGRLTTEVPVIIRFTFHVKHTTKNNEQRHNVTQVNVKRNKICLLKENHNAHHPPPQAPSSPIDPNQHKEKRTHLQNTPPPDPGQFTNTSTIFYPPPPPVTTTPSLLLAGLLGACAVSASVVSVLFFICLKKRLQKLDEDGQTGSTSSSDRSTAGEKYYDHGQSFANTEASPACLLRNTSNQRPGLWLEPKKDYSQPAPPLPNSYVNIANFWNDMMGTSTGGIKNGSGLGSQSTFGSHNGQNRSPNNKGSDVSPYAYAQIIHPQPQQSWYQSSKVQAQPLTTTTSGAQTTAHIYANHLSSFADQHNPPSPNFTRGVNKTDIYEGVDEVYENYGGRSLGSGSLIQIDGFQCPKSFTKESHVVERFL